MFTRVIFDFLFFSLIRSVILHRKWIQYFPSCCLFLPLSAYACTLGCVIFFLGGGSIFFIYTGTKWVSVIEKSLLAFFTVRNWEFNFFLSVPVVLSPGQENCATDQCLSLRHVSDVTAYSLVGQQRFQSLRSLGARRETNRTVTASETETILGTRAALKFF